MSIATAESCGIPGNIWTSQFGSHCSGLPESLNWKLFLCDSMRMDVSKFLGVLDVLFSLNSTYHGVSCNIFPSVTKWPWSSLKATPVHPTGENKFQTLGQPWTQSPKLTDRVYPAGCRRQVLCVTLATWEPQKAELAYPTYKQID